jgi:hypothetical protein
MENYDSIWETVFSQRVKKETVSQPNKSNCEHLECENFICLECGVVLENHPEFDNYAYEHPIESKGHSTPFNRLSKLQEWIAWSKEEKVEYKLKKYVREFCEQLSIYPNLIDSVCNLVYHVLEKIKEKNDGSKRSRVKDAIIINCITYINKDYCPYDLAKRANIDVKYISKADRVLLGLNLLKNAPQTEKKDEKTFRQEFLCKQGLLSYLEQIEQNYVILTELCEDNQLLPQSDTSVICFYYLLDKILGNSNGNLVNTFSDHFKITTSHLIKSLNKLKKLQEKIDKWLNLELKD